MFRLLIATIFAGALSYAGPFVYVTSFSGQFGTVDVTTGVFTSLGTTMAGEIAGLGAKIYGTDGTNFVSVNPLNGVTTTIAALSVSVDEFTSLNNTIYLESLDHKLYTVNPANGAVTLVGNTGLTDPVGNGLAVSLIGGQTSKLYATVNGFDFGTFGPINPPSRLYQLSTANGAATSIGLTGLPLSDGSFTCGVIIGGVMYNFSFNGVVTKEYILNATTGALIGSMVVAGLNGVEGLAFTTPEPGALVLCLSGAAMLGVMRRRRG